MALPARAQIVIVGGGPSGLAAALALAREDPRQLGDVLVLERACYPRDKICAGGLGGRADKTLALLGADLDVPSAPVRGISLRLAAGSILQRGRGWIGRVVRRFEFDHALATVAVSRGVRIVEQVRVTSISRVGDRWSVETNQGEVSARVVIGADGIGSVVRRAVAGEQHGLRAQVAEVDTAPRASDPERDLLHFDGTDPAVPGYCWDFPTVVDGRELVCRGAYVLRTGPPGLDAGELLSRHLQRRGVDPSVLRNKRFAERGFFLGGRVSLPGVLLVGEASGVDPITGEGIPQALAYGEAAGRFVAQGLRDGDLRFEHWSDVIGGQRFGIDLAIRARIASGFYGRHRPWLEKFLVDCPWFLRAGVEYFAGRRVPRGDVVRAVLAAGGLWLRWWLSDSRTVAVRPPAR